MSKFAFLSVVSSILQERSVGAGTNEYRDSWLKIVDTKGRSDEQVEDATHDTALYTTIRLGYEKGIFLSFFFSPNARQPCTHTDLRSVHRSIH